MAAAASQSQVFRDHTSSDNGNTDVRRQEVQAAIAKSVELRALHATLMHGKTNTNSPSANYGIPATATTASLSSPVPHHASHFSAQDYPVFTPSYEDKPLPEYHQTVSRSRAVSESWDEYGVPRLVNLDETTLLDCKRENLSSRKGFLGLESHISPAEDQKSVTGSCANNASAIRTSPRAEFYKSRRRNSMGDSNLSITTGSETATRNSKNSNVIVPLTGSHSSMLSSQAKSRGISLMRFFPRLRKKNHKNEASPNRTEPEEASRIFKGTGMMSVEALKKELIEANERRDAALMEVVEMKSSLEELRQKLEYLETYCEGLKRALRQATRAKDLQNPEKPGIFLSNGKLSNSNGENPMPVTEEVMAEGFLQIVSETRLSVKHFCKSLLNEIEESDSTLTNNINSLLQPYRLSFNSRHSKAVLYHIEAIVNQTLYQDFENCIFQKNGSTKILNPQQDRQARFASFVALRNLSWNEVLRKGTKYYSEELSKFCDLKMSGIITTLNWTRPWPEQLLQAFFVAAKCIWLLHLLAFSFSSPLGILRVEENRAFDSHYMEDVLADRQRPNGPSGVKVMVMPGFYVQGRVLKCKVLCRYK